MLASSRTAPTCVSNIRLKCARLGQVALRVLARTLRRTLAAVARGEVVGTEAQLAGAAVDHRVGEAGDVARCDPDLRVQDHGGVERDHVVALLDHRALPLALDVLVQQDAVVAEVEGRAETAVDVGGREDERAPTAQRRDLLDRGGSFEFSRASPETSWTRGPTLGRVVDECGDLHELDPRTNAVQTGDVLGELVGEERPRGCLRVPDIDVHRSPLCPRRP